MHSRLFEDAKTANLARYAEVHALIHSSALTALTRRSRFACALPIRCFCLSASASPPLPLRFFRNDGDRSDHPDGGASGSALTAAISVISEGGGWMRRLAQPVTAGGHHSRGRPPPPP